MGYQNPPVPWEELERKLSGRPGDNNRLFEEAKFSKDGGDSPAWSQHRAPYAPPQFEKAQRPAGPVTPYAELHAHSNFSFLDGASSPEELVEEAVRLGLHAVGLTARRSPNRSSPNAPSTACTSAWPTWSAGPA